MRAAGVKEAGRGSAGHPVHVREERGVSRQRLEDLPALVERERVVGRDLVRDLDRQRERCVVGVDGPNLEHAATIWLQNTYGGDQVSTWSVLRQSCKPRSPVGLVKQPGHKASAKNDLALAA